ncbi:MAG: oligopeptide/dipeptide ABC transporter ATP-binding protein [Pseudomonadales bacterium]|jgi:oligopeptide/dipeptide ABC transporter ATP-binding protein|nr:oligopeptide/dipeptide ABC transporter ATP-binding protein [Pseudomonadales bacterium]
MTEALVTARALRQTFRAARGAEVSAVDGVDLDIEAGRTLALVGESGCGKTTLGRMLALLRPPTSGSLRIAGEETTTLSRRGLRAQRRQVQMVFQDPVAALNPRHPVEAILSEPLENHVPGPRAAHRARIVELLEAVGLSERDLRRYPHEFSGGQRQRITLARALVLQPAFVVADEPVSALDVSVQSQILNLLVTLRERFGLTYLFISHDLAVVHHIADEVAVMYLGRIVERAPRAVLYDAPAHPYTKALLASVPRIRAGKRRLGRVLDGDPPSPLAPPPGCRFHPRCPHATERCRSEVPRLRSTESGGVVACHNAEQIA